MSLSAAARTYVVNQSKYARLNAFISLVDPSVLVARTGDRLRIDDHFSISDKPIAIKDNICTKEFKTTAASATLKDFTSPYDATVVTLLQDAGAVVVGKTNMDEFGMGSHSTHSKFGPVKMQRHEGEEASAGGSSGGSALAVASGQCWAALGTDTGGSIRLPAAYTGVAGFKPSYGLLSRWGVIAYANSLDTVGIFARSARFVRPIFDKLNEHDPQDPTSMSLSTRSRLTPSKYRKPWRIGIPLDYNIATLHPTVRKAWIDVLRRLWEDGHTLHPVRLPATQHALSAYYVLAPAEASSNLAKYDGVRYGSRAEGIDGTADSVLFAKTRAQGFGPEVQRRILLGAFSLSAHAIDNYFIQAQKVRRLVQKEFDRVFAKVNPLLDHEEPQHETDEKVDILICPTAPSPAPSLADVTHQDPIQAYMNDVFTVPASLAGLPAISIPIPVSGIHPKQPESDDTSLIESVGIQIIGQYGDDTAVLDIAEKIQGFAPSPQIGTGPDTTAWGESMLGQSTHNERRKYSSTARFFGLSIKEHKARLMTEQKQKALPKLTATLEAACGTQHLDDAAAFCGMTRENYIEKFIGNDDPIAAESRYFTNLFKQQEKAYANANAHPQSRTLDALTNLLYSSTGQEVIDAAARRFGESRSRYIGRFIGLEDPVASERRHYRYRAEAKARVPIKRLKSDEEVVHGGSDDVVQRVWTTEYKPHPRGNYGRL